MHTILRRRWALPLAFGTLLAAVAAAVCFLLPLTNQSAVPRLSRPLAHEGGEVRHPEAVETTQAGGPLVEAARRGWADYEQAARKWTFRVQSDYSAFDRGRAVYSSVDEIFVRGNGRCLSMERTAATESSRTPATKTRLLQVVGPEYQFEGRRPPGSSRWIPTEVVRHAAGRNAINRKELPAGRRTFHDDIESDYLLLAVAVDNQLASRLIGHACCRTEHFAPVSPEAGAPVEWRFTVDPSKRPPDMRLIESGRVLLDPGQRWVIREVHTNQRNGRGGLSTAHQIRTYQPGPDGYPVPSEVRNELVTEDRTYTGHGVVKFELVPQKAPPPDTEFTLAAYGMPESSGLRNLRVGMAAPEIEGEDIDGKTFRLSEYQGKVVLLDFWGDW